MESKLCDLESDDSSIKKKKVQADISKRNSMLLPIMVKSLLVCDDSQVSQGINELLQSIKNIELKIETKLTFVTDDIKLALVVYSGNEQQTIADIEKITHAKINIILIGDNLPQKLLRKSLQLSLKDFVPLETAEAELLPAIQNIAKQLCSQQKLSPLISVINGKGGSGASFITNFIGQVISRYNEQNIALLDADLQHGTLADSLNLRPEYYLDDALADVEKLDATAVKSVMCNKSNLSLLPVKAYSLLNRLSQFESTNLTQLLTKVRANYKLLIADISRGLDQLSIPIIENSDQILIVIQQNIVSIREAKALIDQLTNVMGISNEKIHIIINRYSDKYSTITVNDVIKSTGIHSIHKVGNDYELASACTDLGKSLEEIPGSKRIENDLIEIIINVIPIRIAVERNKGFWAKITGK